MTEIEIASNLSALIPTLKLSCIESTVKTEEINEQLWDKISEKITEINTNLQVDEISKLPAIAASRKGYKVCGKDPARYRLSAEALLRRVLKRKKIYQVNNVVDLLNLVSISTGFSIGGYDAEKINGNVEFGIGKKQEPYEGIGRGELNIEFMPVFRDQTGAFGTPTSDSVRTCVTAETKRFLMIIIDYGTTSLNLATQMAVDLLKEYAGATDIELKNIN
uniref:B3/B4 domain-containing protein n=1 Tax=uncultured Draconibacterium sp. TaxID=1573823 RepID=UPI00321714A1